MITDIPFWRASVFPVLCVIKLISVIPHRCHVMCAEIWQASAALWIKAENDWQDGRP